MKYVNLSKDNLDTYLPQKILAEYSRLCDLDDKQNVFLSFLYGMTYSSISSIQMFKEWVHDEEQMTAWWYRNKERLHFQNDKRYIKNMNQYVPALMSYLNNEDYIVEAVMNKTFLEARKVCLNRLRFFGEHALYLMYDVLMTIYGSDFGSIPDRIEWQTNGATVAEGMYRLLGWDEKLPIKKLGIEKNLIPELDKNAYSVASIVELKMGDLESVLCAYAKLFKQTRYFGYYLDRHLGDLFEYENKAPRKILEFNWDFRKSHINHEYLGEFQNWSGIRKEKCKEFVLYGKV